MRIYKSKSYKVIKTENDKDYDCGNFPGEDVQAILKGFKNEPLFDGTMFGKQTGFFFNRTATVAYEVTEI